MFGWKVARAGPAPLWIQACKRPPRPLLQSITSITAPNHLELPHEGAGRGRGSRAGAQGAAMCGCAELCSWHAYAPLHPKATHAGLDVGKASTKHIVHARSS